MPVYLAVAGRRVALLAAGNLGTEIFPQVDAGQFQFRLKAPTGTRIEQTEAITQEALRFIGDEVGAGGEVDISPRVRRRGPVELPDQHASTCGWAGRRSRSCGWR